MTPVVRKSLGGGIAAIAAVVLGGASPGSLLTKTEPGSWEIARSGFEPKRLCLAKIAALAQLEHRNAACRQTVVRDGQTEAVIHYTCRGGDFGQTRMTLMTPRSIRVETQGISANSPFHYTFQARRVAGCAH